ncbi:MAG: hypothetical protein R3Y63_04895 [Eubacteriales bacterium]
MTIKEELIHQALGKYIFDYLSENTPDYEAMVDNKAVSVLNEIQELFQKQEIDPDDFLLVDEIITILNNNGISTGVCHDF